METQRTREEMVEILDRNTAWIENCDNKASIILGVIGVVAGVFLATDYVEKLYSIILFMISKEHLSIWSILYVFIMAASVVGMIVGCLFIIDVLVPRFRMEEYQKRGSARDSVIHYASIAKHKTFSKFRNKLVGLSNEAMLEDLAEQIYICAIICENKFTAYKKGLITCVVSFLIFILMAILGFIITK